MFVKIISESSKLTLLSDILNLEVGLSYTLIKFLRSFHLIHPFSVTTNKEIS